MGQKLAQLLDGIAWTKKVERGHTRFIPIVGKLGTSEIIIGEELSYGLEVSELEQEVVNQVHIHSQIPGKVLVIPGIVLRGGRQTRTTVRPFIIEQGQKIVIPVNCIEAGRWMYDERYQVDDDHKKFKVASKMVSRKTRSSSLGGAAQQSSTWQSISSYMDMVDEGTRAAPSQNFEEIEQEIRKEKKEEIDRLRGAIKPAFEVEDQRGIIILENNEVVHIEVFNDPEKWKDVCVQILESNLLDLLRETPDKKELEAVDVQAFTRKIPESQEKPLGVETAYRIEGEDMLGWIMEDEDTLVYAVASRIERKDIEKIVQAPVFMDPDDIICIDYDEDPL